jgi:hypothetical protein
MSLLSSGDESSDDDEEDDFLSRLPHKMKLAEKKLNKFLNEHIQKRSKRKSTKFPFTNRNFLEVSPQPQSPTKKGSKIKFKHEVKDPPSKKEL